MPPVLTEEQQQLADRRARATLAAAAELDGRSDGFVSIRDARGAAREAGVPAPDWRAERDMVRAAGFGRFRTSGLLGDWESLVNAANEASRWYAEPLALIEVSRRSLAWCLAGQPDGPTRRLLMISRDIVTVDVHDERPERPAYRELLDGWNELLHVDPGHPIADAEPC